MIFLPGDGAFLFFSEGGTGLKFNFRKLLQFCILLFIAISSCFQHWLRRMPFWGFQGLCGYSGIFLTNLNLRSYNGGPRGKNQAEKKTLEKEHLLNMWAMHREVFDPKSLERRNIWQSWWLGTNSEDITIRACLLTSVENT